jgi:NitT/TauT family transport system substrate-binding protein
MRLMLKKLLLVASLMIAGMAQAAESVSFATDWAAQAEQGGFYQALATGLYEKHGLSVKVRQGGPETNTMLLLATGAVEFAMASNGFQIANDLQENVPVKAVMASFQKDPGVLITHQRDVNSLKDMRGKPIMLAKQNITTLWAWLKSKNGFTDQQLRPYTSNLAPFLVNPQAIVEGYLGSEPYQIHKATNEWPKVFLLADYGYSGYGAMVAVKTDLIKSHPDWVRAFVQASIEGWKSYLYGDPGPGNALIKKMNPEMTDELLAYGRKTLVEHDVIGKNAEDPAIGTMTAARWTLFRDDMAASGVYPASLPIEAGYDLSFVAK